MKPRLPLMRKVLVTGAVVGGATLGAAGVASAATSSSSSSSTGQSRPSGPPAAAANPATMTHGPGETLLTGTNLQRALTAAKAAVPGATVIRAETDSSGATPYEVHMKKADGSYVTVQLNSSFKVVKTVSGFGPGPAGGSGQARGSAPGAGYAPPGGSAPGAGSTPASGYGPGGPPGSAGTPSANGTAPSSGSA
jgi:hypothetical protein